MCGLHDSYVICYVEISGIFLAENFLFIPSPVRTKHPLSNHGFLSGNSTFHWDLIKMRCLVWTGDGISKYAQMLHGWYIYIYANITGTFLRGFYVGKYSSTMGCIDVDDFAVVLAQELRWVKSLHGAGSCQDGAVRVTLSRGTCRETKGSLSLHRRSLGWRGKRSMGLRWVVSFLGDFPGRVFWGKLSWERGFR